MSLLVEMRCHQRSRARWSFIFAVDLYRRISNNALRFLKEVRSLLVTLVHPCLDRDSCPMWMSPVHVYSLLGPVELEHLLVVQNLPDSDHFSAIMMMSMQFPPHSWGLYL